MRRRRSRRRQVRRGSTRGRSGTPLQAPETTPVVRTTWRSPSRRRWLRPRLRTGTTAGWPCGTEGTARLSCTEDHTGVAPVNPASWRHRVTSRQKMAPGNVRSPKIDDRDVATHGVTSSPSLAQCMPNPRATMRTHSYTLWERFLDWLRGWRIDDLTHEQAAWARVRVEDSDARRRSRSRRSC